MFNDDVQMGFFDVYDQYLLNILYDPRIRPGMSKSEVESLMPDVLATARDWVTNSWLPGRADGLGPGLNPTHAAAETARAAGAN